MRVIFCLQASKTKQYQNKIKPNFGQWLTEVTKLTALSLTRRRSALPKASPWPTQRLEKSEDSRHRDC